MRECHDGWFVRLPDGQVVRANSTASVRHHLEEGRLPRDCRLRRGPGESWQALDRLTEFADLAPARLPRSDGQPLPLQPVGVRSFLEVLVSAADATLVPAKLRIAVGTMAVVGVVPALFLAVPWLPGPLPWWELVTALVAVLVIFATALGATLLTQVTFIELSQLRQASVEEAKTGLARFTARLFFAQLVVAGLPLLAMLGFRWLLAWLQTTETLPGADHLAMALALLALPVVILVWMVIGLTPLLPAVLVVEEQPVFRSLELWKTLVWRNFGWLLLQESVALGFGVVLSLPLLLPLLAAVALDPIPPLGGVTAAIYQVFLAVGFFPLFAFLAVVNVFIYLHLRYDSSGGGRP